MNSGSFFLLEFFQFWSKKKPGVHPLAFLKVLSKGNQHGHFLVTFTTSPRPFILSSLHSLAALLRPLGSLKVLRVLSKFSGFQFSEFSGKFPPKETKTNRSWKLAWLDLTCSYKMPVILQEVPLSLTWFHKECPIISPWEKAGEFWIEVMSFLDSSWSGLASGGIYTIQCPLDIATLVKAAALPIATSTTVTDLQHYINYNLVYNDRQI